MERSSFTDRTNYRNIQEPGSAKSIRSYSPVASPLFPSLAVSFFNLCYDPSEVTVGFVLRTNTDALLKVLFSRLLHSFIVDKHTMGFIMTPAHLNVIL